MSEPYRTTIEDVPLEQGLREDEGWIDMQVQFLIDARAAGLADKEWIAVYDVFRAMGGIE